MKEVEDSGFAFASFSVVACGVRSGRTDDPAVFFCSGGGPNGDLKTGFGESFGESLGEEGIVAIILCAPADVGGGLIGTHVLMLNLRFNSHEELGIGRQAHAENGHCGQEGRRLGKMQVNTKICPRYHLFTFDNFTER